MDRRLNSLLRFGTLALVFAFSVIGFLWTLGVPITVVPILVGSFGGVAFLVFVSHGAAVLVGSAIAGITWREASQIWFKTLPAPFKAPDPECRQCICGEIVAEPKLVPLVHVV